MSITMLDMKRVPAWEFDRAGTESRSNTALPRKSVSRLQPDDCS